MRERGQDSHKKLKTIAMTNDLAGYRRVKAETEFGEQQRKQSEDGDGDVIALQCTQTQRYTLIYIIYMCVCVRKRAQDRTKLEHS